MSKRFVIILWSIAGVLAALTIVVKSNRSSDQATPTQLATGDLLLKDFPLEKIASLKLTDAEDSVTIRKGESQWLVTERDDYPVDFNLFSDLIRALTQVTVAQSMRASEAFNERYGMDLEATNQENHGYQVTFLNEAGETMESLQVGKLTNSRQSAFTAAGESGRYLRLASDPNAVYAVNNPIFGLSGNPADWLDPTFLQVRNVASLTFTPAPDTGMTGWSLSRASLPSDFVMSDLPEGMELNREKTDPLKNALASPQFSDVLSEEDAQTMRAEGQERTLQINTFDGLVYTLTYAPESSIADQSADEDRNFIASFTITGELKSKRTPSEGESEEEAKRADEVFREQFRLAQEMLSSNLKLTDRYFLVPDYVFSQFDLSQSDLLQARESALPTQPLPLQPTGLPGQPAAAADLLNEISEADLQRMIQGAGEQQQEE